MGQTTGATGHYIFDLVEPGSYSIAVESPGFSKFIQENVPVAARADITVDATLKTGDVRETVTVAAEASQVQFSTSKLETSVEAKIVRGYTATLAQPVRAGRFGSIRADERQQHRVQPV